MQQHNYYHNPDSANLQVWAQL